MKLKRGILLIVLMLVAFSILGTINQVQAETAVRSKTLNIKAVRSSGYGYKVVNNGAKYIWKIYNTRNDINETFYCIKGGPGFGGESMDSAIGEAEYTEVFDMRKPSTITTPYRPAINLIYGTKDYERLMWVLDQCYIPAKNNASSEDRIAAEESKTALLNAVEEYAKKYPLIYDNTSDFNERLVDNLTDDDIDAIQQLAVWYYTNDDAYHVENNPNIYLGYQDNTYAALNSNDDEDNARIHAMNALFDYLTKTPKEAGFSYDYETDGDISSPVEIKETNPSITTEGNRYIVGPYTINQLRNINYTLEATFTDGNGTTITDVKFLNSSKVEVADATIKDMVGTNKIFYISIPVTTNATKIKMSIAGSYFDTTINYWSVANPDPRKDQPVVQVEKGIHPIIDSIETKQEKKFDLALRKFITSINGKTLTGDDSRVPVIDPAELEKLANKQATGINNTTAKKEHRKDALIVQTGDKVVYTIRIYNEGEIAGWATQITDHLPSGLQFVPKAESTINNTYGWEVSADGRTVTTNYLAAQNKKMDAFNGTNLDFEDIQIECEVIATAGATTKNLKNIAEITEHKDEEGNINKEDLDRDSQPGSLTSDQINNYGTTSKQDDDDFEDLKLLPKAEKEFDLSLRKFISDVTTDGKSHVLVSREPIVDVKPLLEGESTANYNHTKKPVGVSNNDIVTYTIRVYNEGQVDGYITKITDHLPSQLEFLVDDELNKQYGWEFVSGSNGRTIETDITSPETKKSANRDLIYADRVEGNDKVLLKAFGYKDGETLDYIDVQIRCKVKEDINLYEKITNIAEISGFTDKEGNKIVDRDSQEENAIIPTDETLPKYKDPEIESGKQYIEGQQDDDDFEKLELRIFDLALRKFITGVTNGEKTTDITDRAPVFIKNGTEYSYEHTKEPVEVANGNIVIYTLRIFNEGNVAGYASKVKDDLPDGLEFLPEHSINTAFQWKMYQEDGTETKEVSNAKYIETDFLSKDKEKTEKENLITAFNPEIMDMPDYKDVKIAFKVTEPNTSDRIIINQAQISDDSDEDGNSVDDVDSIPDEWNEGEDDQDIEKVKVKYFDLSLKKWVTESIVTVDGKTTVTKSGHTGNENPEPPMKVEIQNGKINKTTVKFRFNIKVTNEGEIAGYAKEIEDYIPEGLKFVAKDNPKWTQKDGRVTTDQLKDKLLQPGESATVDIVLTWINGKDNMGEKVNWAEISKDENEYNSPDIDSTPGNKVKGEDDIDQAPVLLAPATGSTQTYSILVLGCTSILAGGIFLIKKYVI